MTRRLPPGQRLVLATHNPGKLREIAAMLAPLGVEVVSAAALFALPGLDHGCLRQLIVITTIYSYLRCKQSSNDS